MTFRIRGLDLSEFSPLLNLPANELADRGIVTKTADTKPGFPCRITLEDAAPGERVLLLNYESHKPPTPYRSAYAIYVRVNAKATAVYVNELPPVFANRPIALRLFDQAGFLLGADMGINNELTAKIEAALSNREVAYLHAHNAMHGCFAAEITRN